MIAKERKKLLALCLSLAMMISVFPVPTLPAQEAQAAGYGISNPRTDENSVSTWDCIYFGNYWQNDTNGNGVADQKDAKQPIKWRVLSVNGDDAFLLADKNLDCQPYNTERKAVTWETCTLRNWLNNDFYNAAFSDTEKSAIETTLVVNEDNPWWGAEGGNNTKDKVYLLSIKEALNLSYGFSSDYMPSETREAKNTEYVGIRLFYLDFEEDYVGNGIWWLRSPGEGSRLAASVSIRGGVYNFDNSRVDNSGLVVRPALQLNLSSDKWSKADAVSASGRIPSTSTTKPSATDKLTATLSPTSKPKAVTKPAGATKLTAKNKKKNSVTLTWKKVSGAKGYQVQYAANKKFKKKTSKLATKFTSKTKFTVKKLKKKKIYYFRVRAYKLNGKKKVYGRWSAVKRVKVKK